MSEAEIYDRIGPGYASQRKPDRSWLDKIHAELGAADTLINVGAGSGSYEPRDITVVALEPSFTMINQRATSAAPVVCGIAEQLPFNDGAFDVAMAVLTVHHWTNPMQGLAEMCRVSGKQIVVTWDADIFTQQFWLVRDYLPEIAQHEAGLATLEQILGQFQQPTVRPLPVPENCTDGFFGAFWKRPQTYLNKQARQAMSVLALLDQDVVDSAMEKLQSDLDSGRWHDRNSSLLGMSELDLGYRMVIAETEHDAD